MTAITHILTQFFWLFSAFIMPIFTFIGFFIAHMTEQIVDESPVEVLSPYERGEENPDIVEPSPPWWLDQKELVGLESGMNHQGQNPRLEKSPEGSTTITGFLSTDNPGTPTSKPKSPVLQGYAISLKEDLEVEISEDHEVTTPSGIPVKFKRGDKVKLRSVTGRQRSIEEKVKDLDEDPDLGLMTKKEKEGE